MPDSNQQLFDKDGYVILKNIINRRTLGKLKRQLNNEVKHLRGSYDAEQDKMTQWCLPHRLDNGVLYDTYQRYPYMRPLAEHSKITDFIQQRFNSGVYLYVSSYLFKPPGSDNQVPWHQDFLSQPDKHDKIVVWIALDNMRRNNGCIKVIPGSHKGGFRQFTKTAGATHHSSIELTQEDEANVRYVEMQAGDALVFSNYLIHSSEQNDSADYRRAARFVYASSDHLVMPRCTPIIIKEASR